MLSFYLFALSEVVFWLTSFAVDRTRSTFSTVAIKSVFNFSYSTFLPWSITSTILVLAFFMTSTRFLRFEHIPVLAWNPVWQISWATANNSSASGTKSPFERSFESSFKDFPICSNFFWQWEKAEFLWACVAASAQRPFPNKTGRQSNCPCPHALDKFLYWGFDFAGDEQKIRYLPSTVVDLVKLSHSS